MRRDPGGGRERPGTEPWLRDEVGVMEEQRGEGGQDSLDGAGKPAIFPLCCGWCLFVGRRRRSSWR